MLSSGCFECDKDTALKKKKTLKRLLYDSDDRVFI